MSSDRRVSFIITTVLILCALIIAGGIIELINKKVTVMELYKVVIVVMGAFTAVLYYMVK